MSEGVVMAGLERAGKDKTALQMVAIMLLIVHQDGCTESILGFA
ncbi:MAG: hypothetical protein R3A47_11880 [Polyangiales bacterium]